MNNARPLDGIYIEVTQTIIWVTVKNRPELGPMLFVDLGIYKFDSTCSLTPPVIQHPILRERSRVVFENTTNVGAVRSVSLFPYLTEPKAALYLLHLGINVWSGEGLNDYILSAV